MAERVRVTAEVQTPRVPNFLRMTDGQTLPVGGVEDEGLREIGQLWTEELLERAREQRRSWTAGN